MTDEKKLLEGYRKFLHLEEKSEATIKKYQSIAREFLAFLGERPLTKEETLDYKDYLEERHVPNGVNVKLSGINNFMKYLNREDCRVNTVKVQREIFASPERELKEEECQRLLEAAYETKYWYILQCFCETGIRVSELKFITVEAIRKCEAVVNCKNKVRKILISDFLRSSLLEYAEKQGIKKGSIFVTRTGRPMDRFAIWRGIKKFSGAAKVNKNKVFPHNFRHLFARMYYQYEKDIVKLADLMGHSSIRTTRNYTKESGEEHRKGLEYIFKELRKERPKMNLKENVTELPKVNLKKNAEKQPTVTLNENAAKVPKVNLKKSASEELKVDLEEKIKIQQNIDSVVFSLLKRELEAKIPTYREFLEPFNELIEYLIC